MRSPELADRLAAAYALGTLRGGARRRFESIARERPMLRALALAWRERLAAMTELQPGHTPSLNVWKRIALELEQQRQAAHPPPRVARVWRARAWAGALATVVAVGISALLAAQLRAAPEIGYVAVLADDRAAPTVLVTFDPKHRTLTLKRVAPFDEGDAKSLQLWALPPGGAPRSLGVVPQGPIARLKAAEGEVEVPALAISLEPRGGVPGESGPTGPVLFKGAVLPAT